MDLEFLKNKLVEQLEGYLSQTKATNIMKKSAASPEICDHKRNFIEVFFTALWLRRGIKWYDLR